MGHAKPISRKAKGKRQKEKVSRVQTPSDSATRPGFSFLPFTFYLSPSRLCLVLACGLLCGGWRAPLMAQAPAEAYAVQVAALQSQESAEALVSGLRVRGLDAYWVKGEMPGQGKLYRVRLGKFVSESRARAYAERLRKSGLLNQYFIPAYEPPSKVAASMPPPVVAAASSPDQARPVSADSASASAPVSSAAASASPGQAERETIILIASRQWAAPAPLASLAASPRLAEAPPTTPPPPSPRVKSAPTTPLNAPPVAASPKGASSVTYAPPATAPSSSSSSSGGASSVASAAPPPSAINTAVSLPPPEVGPTVTRPAVSPAVSSVSSGASEKLPAAGGEAPDLGPPLLHGTVESRNGQLQLVVQNLDARQSFKGRATVTVDDGKRQSESPPMPLALRPDEERAFPLNASLVNGSYTMMIYDEHGGVRIIRVAPLGAGLPQSKTAGATSSSPPPPSLPENDISVVPRQIAATSENITLEFEITSQRPLGYITLTLRVGSAYTQPQRAVLASNQGRIPFLVPTRLPETAFTYELKDDSERVLLTGEDDLRRLVKN